MNIQCDITNQDNVNILRTKWL